jgi:large subunit ribosomal protein L31e
MWCVRAQVTRETTIHLAKLLHKTTFKKRAPRAVRAIKAFAEKAMGTKDVRIDVKLNKAIWATVTKNKRTK